MKEYLLHLFDQSSYPPFLENSLKFSINFSDNPLYGVSSLGKLTWLLLGWEKGSKYLSKKLRDFIHLHLPLFSCLGWNAHIFQLYPEQNFPVGEHHPHFFQD